MGLTGEQAYALSKGYVDATANGLGAIAGAPCTIKDTTKIDGETTVTFEWTGISGDTQTSQISVMDGTSPTVSIQRTTADDGAVITIANPDGTTTSATVYDGKGGDIEYKVVDEVLVFQDSSDATVINETLVM